MPTYAPQTAQEHGATTRIPIAKDSAIQPLSATSIKTDSPPTAMQRFQFRPLRRSSSRIQRWVQDQQKRYSSGDDVAPGASDAPDAASGCNPYLAYPHLTGTIRRTPEDVEEVISLDDDFVYVDSDVPDDAPVTEVVDLSSAPPTPRRARQGTISFSTPSPFRTLARNLAHTRRISTSTATTIRDQSPSPSRPSIFPRPPRTSTHSRASSLTPSLFPQRPQRDAPSEGSILSSSSSTWKFKRAGLLSHFTGSEVTIDEGSRSPRPSTESSFSRSSETTYTRTSLESTSTSHFRAMRAHTPSMFFTTTPSLWSLPTDASHMDDPPESEKTIARDTEKVASARIPIHFNGPAASSAASILSSQRRRRKRKLVISGIPPGDSRRYEHVRLWCESFGELNQITRVPNGDLHVDFRRSEVADTVCRLHARVHINGVGSVGLSWFTGKKP